jgi:hypothetical protein
MFTLETSFKPLLLGGGGGVYVTVNSEEEILRTFETFVPITFKNLVFGLRGDAGLYFVF